MFRDMKQKHMQQNIESNPVLFGEDINSDNTGIGRIMAISFFLKFLEVMIIIVCCCYYFAMVFKILCELQNEILGWDNFGVEGVDEPEHFTSFYGISPEGTWGMDAMIVLCYFSFTSLTTVGFGDYNPRSDWERLFIAFGLLMGVAIFSVIMGIFIEIVDKVEKYNAGNDDGDGLSQFFGTLKHFNGNEDIDLRMKRDIERYFDHKWEVDKNIIINHKEYEGFLQQIPGDVIDAVYKNFLFTDFLDHYKKLFQYPKADSPNAHAFYTWEDVEYRTLMFGILNNLEPIRYESKEIIFDELDEYSAVIFLMKNAYF